MRLWTLPFRLLGIITLAILVSGGWLFRREILRLVRPPAVAVKPGPVPGLPGLAEPAALARARDKVDSMQGWRADSVVLTAPEMASLFMDGLTWEGRRHVDSLSVVLGEGRMTVSARLETAAIPQGQLGPLAGALDPWEHVTARGIVSMTDRGRAEWGVDSLTLRGLTLPEQASRELLGRALAGAARGAVPLALPPGVAGLRIRPDGVALFREESR